MFKIFLPMLLATNLYANCLQQKSKSCSESQ